MRRLKSVVAAAMACTLAGCQVFSPTPKVTSPYAADQLQYIDARLGYAYETANPSEVFAKEFAKLKWLYLASDACDEQARMAYTIRVDDKPLDVAPGRERTVDASKANCPRIYLDFFETAAEISDTACDEFIERLWAKQRDLRLTSDYTNIASGAASAAVGLFTLGSVIGSLVGLSTVALNEAFKSNATNLLFSLDAGEIRSLIYKQKSLVRDKIDAANGISKMSEAKVRIRDYFLACTPASISEYVGNIIAEASKTGQDVGFLGKGPGNRAQQQAAIATIGAIGEEVGPLIGNGTAMSAQEVAALFAFLSPGLLSGENKDEYRKRAIHYLKQASRITTDEKDIEPSKITLEKRVAEIKRDYPGLDAAEVDKRARTSISTQVRGRMERIGWYSQLGDLISDYLGKLPPVPASAAVPAPAAPAAPAVPVPDVNEGLVRPAQPGADLAPPPPVVTPNGGATDAVPNAGSDMNPGVFGDQ